MGQPAVSNPWGEEESQTFGGFYLSLGKPVRLGVLYNASTRKCLPLKHSPYNEVLLTGLLREQTSAGSRDPQGG